LGTVSFTFDSESSGSDAKDIRRVTVELAGGITPTELQRLPWARLLTAATSYRRAQTVNTADAWRQAGGARHVSDAAPRWDALRPRRGRPSLGASFYKAVADEYSALCSQGARDPVRQIAQRRDQNRNTVARWVRTARRLDFLPAARRGKPG
jgi:hypothetical protein